MPPERSTRTERPPVGRLLVSPRTSETPTVIPNERNSNRHPEHRAAMEGSRFYAVCKKDRTLSFRAINTVLVSTDECMRSRFQRPCEKTKFLLFYYTELFSANFIFNALLRFSQ